MCKLLYPIDSLESAFYMPEELQELACLLDPKKLLSGKSN